MGSHQSSCFQPTNHQPIIIEILKPNIRPRVVVSEMILNDYPNFCSTLSYVYHFNILEHTTEQTPQNSNICYTITYIRVTTTFSVIFLVFMKSPNSSKHKSHIISNFNFFYILPDLRLLITPIVCVYLNFLVTSVTRHVPLVEQELLSSLDHLCSPLFL